MRNRARPKRPQREQWAQRNRVANERAEDLITRLVAFEDFRDHILPALRKDVTSGMSAAELRAKYAAIVQARQITEAITNPDAGKAAAIAKDIADRVEGRPTERKIVEHKYAQMTDEELDAVLKSEMDDLDDMEQRFEQ